MSDLGAVLRKTPGELPASERARHARNTVCHATIFSPPRAARHSRSQQAGRCDRLRHALSTDPGGNWTWALPQWCHPVFPLGQARRPPRAQDFSLPGLPQDRGPNACRATPCNPAASAIRPAAADPPRCRPPPHARTPAAGAGADVRGRSDSALVLFQGEDDPLQQVNQQRLVHLADDLIEPSVVRLSVFRQNLELLPA